MDYLIDTHILIWCVLGDPLLSKKAIKEIDDPKNRVLLSSASLWEIAIKVNLGKLTLGIPFDDLEAFLRDKNFYLLEYNYKDLSKLAELPNHHRDPFDRLIICQALTNNLTIITDDKKFKLYPVSLL
jgi:PIN domain nuclease of toxin-antitoxin system